MNAPSADTAARLAALEAENVELRDRLDFYRITVFGEDLRFPADWRLTKTEAKLLAALLSPLEYMSADALMSALYAGDVDDEPDVKIIDVYVCKLRRKLRGRDIEIRTLNSRGFSIPEPRRSELRRALRLVSMPPWEHSPSDRRFYQPCSANAATHEARV